MNGLFAKMMLNPLTICSFIVQWLHGYEQKFVVKPIFNRLLLDLVLIYLWRILLSLVREKRPRLSKNVWFLLFCGLFGVKELKGFLKTVGKKNLELCGSRSSFWHLLGLLSQKSLRTPLSLYPS